MATRNCGGFWICTRIPLNGNVFHSIANDYRLYPQANGFHILDSFAVFFVHCIFGQFTGQLQTNFTLFPCQEEYFVKYLGLLCRSLGQLRFSFPMAVYYSVRVLSCEYGTTRLEDGVSIQTHYVISGLRFYGAHDSHVI